jgi:predicted RNase H-like nuclease
LFLLEIPTTGAALKATEDKLDSLICAYVAAYWWYWGEQRNLVLGDCTTGYIIIPKEYNYFRGVTALHNKRRC